MKTLDEKDIYQKLLDSNDSTLMLKIQMETTSIHNKDKIQDALRVIELYTKVLKTKQNVHLYFYRGYNYRMLNEDKKAIDDYTEIIKLDDDFYSIYALRADLYSKITEYDLSIADYSIAIPRSGHYELYLSRAECYFMLNEFDLAKNDWNQAINLKLGADAEMDESRAKMYAESDRLEQEERLKKK